MSDITDTPTISPEHEHGAWDKLSDDEIKAKYTHTYHWKWIQKPG